jgi:protein-disulfide isomerase
MKPLLRTVVLALVLLPPAGSAQNRFIGVDDDPALGDPKAPVTIIEFGDYQCPYCRQFWRETFPRLKKEYIDTGKVRFIYRDYPQAVHPEAMLSAMAAECADDQGKYYEFHDKLFREQDRRGRDVVRFRTPELKRWAADITLDTAAFNACLDDERHKDEVSKDFKDLEGLGLEGTPIFFVNGRGLLGAHPFATFQKLIEAFLK